MEKNDFTGKVGSKMSFASSEKTVELELTGVDDLKPLPEESRVYLNNMPHMKAAGITVREKPFSLMFRGPAASPLPPDIHKVSGKDLGEFELTISQIGADEKSIYYQAVFH